MWCRIKNTSAGNTKMRCSASCERLRGCTRTRSLGSTLLPVENFVHRRRHTHICKRTFGENQQPSRQMLSVIVRQNSVNNTANMQ